MFSNNDQMATIKKLCEQAGVITADESASFVWHAQCGALIEKCKAAAIIVQPQHAALAEQLSILAANLDMLAYEPRLKSHRDNVETSIALVTKQTVTL
jgi:hypothetical protein